MMDLLKAFVITFVIGLFNRRLIKIIIFITSYHISLVLFIGNQTSCGDTCYILSTWYFLAYTCYVYIVKLLFETTGDLHKSTLPSCQCGFIFFYNECIFYTHNVRLFACWICVGGHGVVVILQYAYTCIINFPK